MASEDINEIVTHVASKKAEWAALAAGRKLEILDLLLDNLNAHCEQLQSASIAKRDGDGDVAPSYTSLSKEELSILQNASRASHWLHSAMVCFSIYCPAIMHVECGQRATHEHA